VPIEKDSKITIKKYEFSEVTDLQDKLTLVVGEEHQEVIKYFENILESIIDLTKVFIKLLKSGNILFKNWSLRVYCDRTKSTTIKANFGLKDESNLKNIIGLRDYEKDTVNIQHINQKRDEFTLFNYFTIQQLTLLRTKLIHVNQLNDNNNNNYNIRYLTDLLYNINPDCNLELLQKANEYAHEQLTHIAINDSQSICHTENLHEINEDLRSQGFSLELIKEAFRQNNQSDFSHILNEYKDALFNFCIQNESSFQAASTQNIYSYVSLRLESIFDDMVHEYT
jgi:hypothetical protein